MRERGTWLSAAGRPLAQRSQALVAHERLSILYTDNSMTIFERSGGRAAEFGQQSNAPVQTQSQWPAPAPGATEQRRELVFENVAEVQWSRKLAHR